MANQEWNWGQDVEKFPSALWDDMDATVELMEYQTSNFGNVQVFLVLRPAEYEFDARGMDYDAEAEYSPEADSNSGFTMGWYGMGSGEYIIAEDGFDISGPAPQRSTRAVKLITSMRSLGGVKFTSASLSPAQGANSHWKAVVETSTNPTTREKVERAYLYCAGKPVGSTVYGKSKADAGSAGRGRRSQVVEESDEESQDEAPAKRSARGRRGRAAAQAEAPPTPTEELEVSENVESSSEPNVPEGGLDDAIDAIVQAVSANGESGLSRRKLRGELLKLQEALGESVIVTAMKKETLAVALEGDDDAALREDNGRLFLS